MYFTRFKRNVTDANKSHQPDGQEVNLGKTRRAGGGGGRGEGEEEKEDGDGDDYDDDEEEDSDEDDDEKEEEKGRGRRMAQMIKESTILSLLYVERQPMNRTFEGVCLRRIRE